MRVQLIRRDPLNPDWILDSTRADPGHRVRVGPARVSGGKVVLEAGERTPEQAPAVLKLRAGSTSVVVGYEPDGRTLVFNKAEDK